MHALLTNVMEDLARGRPPSPAVLARLGDPEPLRASRFLQRASELAELAPLRSSWVPALLLGGRPGRTAQLLHQLTLRMRGTRDRALDLRRVPSLVPVLGASEFLARILLEDPSRVDDLVGDPPSAPSLAPIGPGFDEIREAKYRGLLRVAARELIGCPLSESLSELSDLIERCLIASLETACAAAACAVPCVVVLGSLAGREASIAPDLPVFLLVGDEQRLDVHTRLRLQEMTDVWLSGLEKTGLDGRLLRVRALTAQVTREEGPLSPDRLLDGLDGLSDRMGLRVEPFDDALGGLVRSRAIQGPVRLRARFEKLRRARAFGPRAAVRAVRGEAPCSAGIACTGDPILADLEQIVRGLQQSHAGKDARLYTPNLSDALMALGLSGWLPERDARGLLDAHAWLRRSEHFVQMRDEGPDARLPEDREGQIALARAMGYREPDAEKARQRLLDDRASVCAEVEVQRLRHAA